MPTQPSAGSYLKNFIATTRCWLERGDEEMRILETVITKGQIIESFSIENFVETIEKYYDAIIKTIKTYISRPIDGVEIYPLKSELQKFKRIDYL